MVEGLLSAIFSEAVRCGLILANPVRGFSRPRASGRDARHTPTPMISQLRTLLDAVKPEYGFFFVGQRGGIIDLENLAARIMKPFLQAHALKWHGWHATPIAGRQPCTISGLTTLQSKRFSGFRMW